MEFLRKSLAMTGIGSLPYFEVNLALDSAFALDIPYLPTLPQVGPAEGLLEEGPSLAWQGFVQKVASEGPAWVKVQTVGPLTLSLARQDLAPDLLREQVWRFLSQTQDRVQQLIRLGSRVLVFVDEPSLFQFDLSLRGSEGAWARLAGAVQELRLPGVQVGLHCCGRVNFAGLWDLGVDFLSFDTELSLVDFFAGGNPLKSWLAAGGRPALGVIPTLLRNTWNCTEEVRKCRSEFFAALGPEMGERVLRESLLTPACGLGLRSVTEAETVFAALREFKTQLLDE